MEEQFVAVGWDNPLAPSLNLSGALLEQALKFQSASGFVPDGIIGPRTLRIAHNADIERSLARMFSYRAEFYASLVTSNTALAKYRRGWFKRLFLLQQFIFNHLLIKD